MTTRTGIEHGAAGRHRRLRRRRLDRRRDLIVAPLADVQHWYGLGARSRASWPRRRPASADAARRRVCAGPSAQPRDQAGEQTAADDAKQATTASAASSRRRCWPSRARPCSSAPSSSSTPSRSPSRSAGASSRCCAPWARPGGRCSRRRRRGLVLGVTASVLGLLCGLGFARGLGALFDAAGWGIPRGGMQLAGRTIVIGPCRGHRRHPRRRADPRRARDPGAARGGHARRGAGRGAAAQLRRRVLTALVGLAGPRALGPGPVRRRPGPAAGSGDGARLAARLRRRRAERRYVVRPLAAVVGWPLQRLGHATGELARDNATRNPARTAVTAAALMVGLALVVFVSVFAAGLKDSIDGAIADRAKAELVVTSDTVAPLSRAAGPRIDRVPSVVATAPQYLDQVQVNGRKSARSPTSSRHRPAGAARRLQLPLAARLRRRPAAPRRRRGHRRGAVRQGARHHGRQALPRHRPHGPQRHAHGDRRVPRPGAHAGRDGRRRAVPGALVAARPAVLLRHPGAGYRHGDGSASGEGRARRFPSAKVRTRAQYSDYIGAQLDQIVYLLYALLAMSIVISMFGIANSLFLSIHERTRELGMLRAIGATAAQVRRMIRYESVITSLIGGVLGTAVGILFAWLTTFAVKDLGVGFSIPVGQLAVFLAARRRRRGPRRRRARAPGGAPADPGRRAQRVTRSARHVEARRLSGVRRRTGSDRFEGGAGAGGGSTLRVPPISATRSRMPRSPKPSWWASGAKPGRRRARGS